MRRRWCACVRDGADAECLPRSEAEAARPLSLFLLVLFFFFFFSFFCCGWALLLGDCVSLVLVAPGDVGSGWSLLSGDCASSVLVMPGDLDGCFGSHLAK